MPILPSQRHLFDVPDEIAYFNNAYLAPQLKASRERQLAGVHGRSHPWQRTAASFFEDAETVRGLCARVLGGETDGYAVISSASYGVSTAARAVEPRLQAGDKILVIAEEFPSNVLPWKRVAAERGATIVTVPLPADGNWTPAILDRIDAGTRVVAVSPSHWTDGARIDLLPIGSACRDNGSMLVVDASQSLGAAPFALAEIKPDFLVAAAYKWLLCPYGFAVLYVSEPWRGARPLEENWLAREHAEDFANLVRYSDTYMPGSRRFDGGEKCSSTILPGAIAALEQVAEWGVENIARTLAETNARIAAHLERLGFQVPAQSRRSPNMFGAQLPRGFEGNIVAELRKRDIYISQRGNALRFAPHLHVNAHDVDRLLQALEELAR